jgi:hypothetical protein
MKKYFFKFILFCSLSIFFIGCATKDVDIIKEPNCKIKTNISPVFIEVIKKINNVHGYGWDGNLPFGNLLEVENHISKALKKYFPNARVLRYQKNIQSFDNYYYIIIEGIYKRYISQSVTPVVTFNSGQSFNGFVGSTYYFGNIMPSTTTTYVPTIQNNTAVNIAISVFNKNNMRIFSCLMKSSDGYDYDWIDKCIKTLSSCAVKSN